MPVPKVKKKKQEDILSMNLVLKADNSFLGVYQQISKNTVREFIIQFPHSFYSSHYHIISL